MTLLGVQIPQKLKGFFRDDYLEPFISVPLRGNGLATLLLLVIANLC